MPLLSTSERAGTWFLHSGIQERTGGVARYYRSDTCRNARVSTEITGYAVSALVSLHSRLGDDALLEAATRAADFLVHCAWNRELSIFPFEYSNGSGEAPEELAYFFDTGIIARGLIHAWRATREQRYLDGAVAAGESLARHFAGPGVFHPILRLPDFDPVPYTSQWSQGPGCYQLKAALAWHDLFEATDELRFAEWYEQALWSAVACHESFLPAETDEKTMDRLHAYSYFLEAILPAHEDSRIREVLARGIERVAKHLREIAPVFERSDVYAQLLRVRLLADDLGAVPLAQAEAEFEADRIPEFQLASPDRRIDGGFTFGFRGRMVLPYVNPVSTAFCVQALEMWRDFCAGICLDRSSLI